MLLVPVFGNLIMAKSRRNCGSPVMLLARFLTKMGRSSAMRAPRGGRGAIACLTALRFVRDAVWISISCVSSVAV